RGFFLPACPAVARAAPPPPPSPPSPLSMGTGGRGNVERQWGEGICSTSPPPAPPSLLLPPPTAPAVMGGRGSAVATVHTAPVARVSAASAVASYLLSSHSPASSSSLALCECL
ncbi:unnamed protein product, partial [Closterium sp. NIES-53]